MKISNSKRELARIISENGGWPQGAELSAQDGSDGQVSFYKSGAPIYNKLAKIWNAPGSCVHMYKSRIEGFGRVGVIKNFHQTILSREEYFHLYPAPDADGWIEWKGGECPVGDNDLIDVKFSDGDTLFGVDSDWDWGYGAGICNIIAYRLHKPEQSIGELCDKVTEERKHEHVDCNPTIEQLASDYRNRKDYADRKQQEADAAKADADAALFKLELAGEAIGLIVTPVRVEKEPELVISDWRDLQVGDEIEYLDGRDKCNVGMVGRVTNFDHFNADTDRHVRMVSDTGRSGWPTKWRFIRRP